MMMFRNRPSVFAPLFPLTLAAVLASLALLTGCKGPPAAAKPDPVSEARYPKVTAIEGLGSHVVSGKPMATRTQSGALSAVVPVRSQLNKDTPIQYRFFFFNDKGLPLEPEMDWKYEVLPARSQIFLRATSLSKNATDWRADIRPAR